MIFRLLVAALVLMATAALADGVANLGNGTTGNADGITNAGPSGGSGPPPNPLRIVATNGAVPSLLVAQAAVPGRIRASSRIPIVFGCAATGVQFSFDNWYLSSPSSGLSTTVDAVDSTGKAQPVSIVGMALEPGGTAPGTTLPPVTFSGSNSATIASGGTVRSDPLVTPVVANQLYWIRVLASIPAPGTGNSANWLLGPAADGNFVGPNGAGDVAGGPMYPASVANLNLEQVYTAGPLPAFVNASPRIQGFGPSATLGRCPTTGNISVVNIGASWSVGFDDPFAGAPPCATNNTAIATGIGLLPHAAIPNGVIGTQTIPFVKIAVGGTGTGDATNWIDASATGRAVSYLGFGNVLFDDMGANDVQTLTAAQIEAANSATWARAKSFGIQKVVVMNMTQRTSSTDGWATAANQTQFVNFGVAPQVGGQINADYAGTLASQINGVLTAASSQDTSVPNPWLWRSNGTAGAFTCAGLHPNATDYPTIGAELRTILLSPAILTGLN